MARDRIVERRYRGLDWGRSNDRQKESTFRVLFLGQWIYWRFREYVSCASTGST